jgi:uncharacterized protein (DUF433 family)
MSVKALETFADEAREAYPADRAAALAGVPRSTLHYWASHEIWKPSVSAERVRLWSLYDIVVLRVIYWLRRDDKATRDGAALPRTTMNEVRRLLSEGWNPTSSHLYVDQHGRVVRELASSLEDLGRQQLARANVIDVLAEYRVAEGTGVVGPSLIRPRPLLRIIPGKLAGEPHVVNTRLSSATIDGLLGRGYTSAEVLAFYPFLTTTAIEQSTSLEEQLRANLRRHAA